MAKVTEGDPYYYGPHRFNRDLYKIYRRGGEEKVLAEGLTSGNASHIVDALNIRARMSKNDVAQILQLPIVPHG